MCVCIGMYKRMNRELLVKREQEFSYWIYLRDHFDHLPAAIEKAGLGGRKLCIVTDSQVSPLYEETVRRQLEKVSPYVTSFCFPAGEAHKNLETIQKLYEHLILKGLDRKSFLVALGGGVTGDMTGFAAATYLRGIPFIQIPTTLLAQVDSSIGGKTGVDFLQYKNMVGAFHQPSLVYMNLQTLTSLPKEEFACGMGEVLKSGLICDGEFYRWLKERRNDIAHLDLETLSEMIWRCCSIKGDIVERDPRELGDRALLNLGHTIGHAVEKLKDFTMLHGQCVGAGTIAAACISRNRGLLTEEEYQEIRALNEAYHLPSHVAGLTAQEILDATRKDKKMENGQVKFILMKGIGHSFVDKSVTDEELLRGIEEILL